MTTSVSARSDRERSGPVPRAVRRFSSCRVLAFLLVLFGADGTDRVRAQWDRPGCDPVSWEEIVPPPAGSPPLVCGDGILGTYVAGCSRTCAGGCPGVEGCSAPMCLSTTEVCDGATLGGASCRSLGFAGGSLACEAGCAAFDTTGCEVCFARGGTRCGGGSLPGPIEALRIVPGASGTLLLWQSAGSLRHAVAGADLVLGPMAEVGPAQSFDAVPVGDGWLLATLHEGQATLERIGADGARTSLERLPTGASEVVLWRIEGGGVVLTTGAARGTPIRVMDASAAPMVPALPAHATRPDGRMLLVDRTCEGALVAAGAYGMHTEWVPAAGDFVFAFARTGSSGVGVVREGALVTGLGYRFDGEPFALDVHCGPVPRTTASSDEAILSAVPDEAPLPGTGHLRLGVTRGRYRDAFVPHAGRPIVFSGAAPSSEARPRRPMFAEHPRVRFATYARDGRDVVGAALLDEASVVRVVLARGR